MVGSDHFVVGEEPEFEILVGQGGGSGQEVEGDEDGVVGGVVVLEAEVEVFEVGRSGGELAGLIHDHVAEDLNLDGVLD